MTRVLSFVAVAVVGLSLATSSDAQAKKKTPPALLSGVALATYHQNSLARINSLQDNAVLAKKAMEAYIGELNSAIGQPIVWTAKIRNVAEDGTINIFQTFPAPLGLRYVTVRFDNILDATGLDPAKVRAGQLVILRATITDATFNDRDRSELTVSMKDATISLK